MVTNKNADAPNQSQSPSTMIGQRLREARRAKRMTLAEASAEAGISLSTLQRYERGDRRISATHVLSLCRIYGHDPNHFLTARSGATDGQETLPFDDPEQALYRQLRDDFSELECIRIAAEIIARHVRTAAMAVFQYDWQAQKLVRHHNYLAPRYQGRSENFREQYDALGQEITPQAWRSAHQSSRFIPEYSVKSKNSPQSVNPTSFDWHQQVLGDVLSTMYGEISNGHDRFLLRCFNRTDCAGNIPLEPIQYDLLNDLCQMASRVITRKATHDYLTRIAKISADYEAGRLEPDVFWKWLSAELGVLNVDLFSMLLFDRQTSEREFQFYCPILGIEELPESWKSWILHDIPRTCRADDNVPFIEAAPTAEAIRLAGIEQRYASALILPVSKRVIKTDRLTTPPRYNVSTTLRGALVCFIKGDSPGNTLHSVSDLSEAKIGRLHTIAKLSEHLIKGLRL